MAGSREPSIDQTLSQPVWACTEGLFRAGWVNPWQEEKMLWYSLGQVRQERGKGGYG